MTVASKYLRLVSSQPDSHSAPQQAGRAHIPKQLSFPLSEPAAVVLINEESLFRAGAFRRLIDRVRPRWLFDVRVLPRWDTLAGGRSVAFQLFGEHGVRYVDLFGRLDVRSMHSVDANPAFWADHVQTLIRDSRKTDGPFVFLFPTKQARDAAVPVIPAAVSAAAKLPTPVTLCIVSDSFLDE